MWVSIQTQKNIKGYSMKGDRVLFLNILVLRRFLSFFPTKFWNLLDTRKKCVLCSCICLCSHQSICNCCIYSPQGSTSYFPSIILFSTVSPFSHGFQCYRLTILLSKRESCCWPSEPLDSIRMEIRESSLFTFSIYMSVRLWVVLYNPSP